MSGGIFDHIQHKLNDVADEILRYMAREANDPEYPLPREIAAKFAEAAKTVGVASAMIQRVDWLLSGDDGYDCFLQRWQDEVVKLQRTPAKRLPMAELEQRQAEEWDADDQP